MPSRRRGVEILDDPATDPAVRLRSIRDVARANTLLGGTRALLTALTPVLRDVGPRATLLDVGTGLADIPRQARERARRLGVALATVGVDEAESLFGATRSSLDAGACADVRRLPFASGSVDVVTCSQLLHHFDESEVPLVLRELDRVSRGWVIVSDLRRSWLAACGFWLASWPLRFHRVTRHDGFVSVLRGFTGDELARHVYDATGRRAAVRSHLGYRITASWRAGPH